MSAVTMSGQRAAFAGPAANSAAMSEERPLRAPSQEPMKIGSVDVEEFSRNLARLIEEGGRALAAYLKPREEGRKSNALAEEVGRSRQDARPGRGILAGRPAARAGSCRTAWARPISICGLRRQNVSPARRSRRSSTPGSRRQALCRSGMVVEPVLRLPQAGLSADARAGPSNWSATPPTSIRTPGRRPSSTSGRSPTRCRRRISC